MSPTPLSQRLMDAADALREFEKERGGGKWIFDVAVIRQKARELMQKEAAATLHAAQVTELRRDCLEISQRPHGSIAELAEELVARGWRKTTDPNDSGATP